MPISPSAAAMGSYGPPATSLRREVNEALLPVSGVFLFRRLSALRRQTIVPATTPTGIGIANNAAEGGAHEVSETGSCDCACALHLPAFTGPIVDCGNHHGSGGDQAADR